jgi:hypothetical protein
MGKIMFTSFTDLSRQRRDGFALRFTFVLASLFWALLVLANATCAITIEYEVTDLPDTTLGEDLWQYTYRVSNYTFTAGHGFTIYFDQTRYKNIEAPTAPVNEYWDIIVWQPDIAIPDDGAYDALAVASKNDGVSLAGAFTVSFVWLGNETPGTQRFEVYDLDFNTLESGQTVSMPVNPWDVNGDKTVDILDLVFVGRQFGETPHDDAVADVNNDGMVDILDLSLICQHFGESYGYTDQP